MFPLRVQYSFKVSCDKHWKMPILKQAAKDLLKFFPHESVSVSPKMKLLRFVFNWVDFEKKEKKKNLPVGNINSAPRKNFAGSFLFLLLPSSSSSSPFVAVCIGIDRVVKYGDHKLFPRFLPAEMLPWIIRYLASMLFIILPSLISRPYFRSYFPPFFYLLFSLFTLLLDSKLINHSSFISSVFDSPLGPMLL